MQKLNQQGVSIFEISIITLILLFVIASCWITMKRINSSSEDNYNKTQILDKKYEQ